MSAFFSWQHAIRSSKLESTTKLVCYTIWSHMASDGSGCFPSYALIADESGLSRRSVIEHVGKAALEGFLQVDNRQRENGSASSNLYRPTMPLGSERAAPGGERGSLGGGEPAAPPEETTLSSKPPSHKTNEPKASTRANPARSVAILLEDLASIPDDLRHIAVARHHLSADAIDDEWAKFRNHHISARSKHTRVDLCWDTWCRNAAKWQRGSKAPAAGISGQGGAKRYDPVAAAKSRAMAELFGDRAEGHGGQAPPAGDDANPSGGGAETVGASFVDVGPGDETSQHRAGRPDGGNSGCHE